MRTEIRFLLAIGLMILVLVGTNLLFPPVPPPDLAPVRDSVVVEQPDAEREAAEPEAEQPPVVPEVTPPPQVAEEADTVVQPVTAPPESSVTVEGPLYRFRFSSQGARLVSVELPSFRSFRHPGPVQLIPEGETAALGQRLLVAGDTVDLRRVPFEPSAEHVSVSEGPETLRFTYDHPTADFGVDLDYTFEPDKYLISVRGHIRGVNAGVLFTDLGSGLALNEAQEEEERRLTAYVVNHTEEGITAVPLTEVDQPRIEDGPLFWAVFKSKFFMLGALAGSQADTDAYLAGVIASVDDPEQGRAHVTVSQPFGPNGLFEYRLYAGPQDFQRLSTYGHDLEDANPYGWKFLRPVIQPFTGLIITVLKWMHERFNLAYGWVLMVFGLMMRVVFFPLYHRSMKAQLKNMAVQPLMKDIQTRYKDNPERMQKELMKLYKEHGFNPLAGCLPMLLPWPVLVALFFVFQNTIELRGEPFLWLPDLSQADPYYILPIFLGISMFLLQWVGFRSMDQTNPQMKMMMWFMPIFLVFIFLRLPSGLNLYYATANIATLPQQFWIAGERKKARDNAPAPPAPEDEPAGQPTTRKTSAKGRKRSRKR